MSVEIGEVVDRVFDKMKEYEFLRLSHEDAEKVLKAYIRPACVKYSDKRGRDLEVDAGLEVIKQDLTDSELDILSSYVCICYIDANYIRTTLTMKPFLSGTDFHAYQNKDVMAQAMKANQAFKDEVDGSAVLRSYRDDNSPFWKVHRNRR